MDKKKQPNRLYVDDIPEANSDNSCVMVSAGKADELGFVNSDMVIIKGKKKHQSPAVLFIDENQNTGNESGEKVYMNKVMRKNLRVKLGDMVTLTKIDDLPNCEQIHVLPFSDSIEGVTGNLFDGYIKG